VCWKISIFKKILGGRKVNMSKKGIFEEMRKILVKLEETTPDVFASAIIRKDGLIVASAVPEEVNKRVFAAMAASALGASSRALKELKQGNLKRLLVEGEGGQMVLMEAGQLVLTTLIRKDANLGLVFMNLEKVVDELKKYA